MSSRTPGSPPTSTGGTILVPAWPGTAVRIAMGIVIAGLVSLVTVAAQIRLAEETVSAPARTIDRPASIGEWPVIDPAPSVPSLGVPGTVIKAPSDDGRYVSYVVEENGFVTLYLRDLTMGMTRATDMSPLEAFASLGLQ